MFREGGDELSLNHQATTYIFVTEPYALHGHEIDFGFRLLAILALSMLAAYDAVCLPRCILLWSAADYL